MDDLHKKMLKTLKHVFFKIVFFQISTNKTNPNQKKNKP